MVSRMDVSCLAFEACAHLPRRLDHGDQSATPHVDGRLAVADVARVASDRPAALARTGSLELLTP